MGREIRRVPLDFAWPLKKVWEGFLNPHYVAETCAVCGGSGSSKEMNHLKDLWYGYAAFKPEDRGSVRFEHDNYVIRSIAERNVNNAPEYYGKGEGAVQSEARRLCLHFNRRWCYHLNQDDVDALVEGGRLYDFTHEWKQGEGWTPKPWVQNPTAAEVNEWSLAGLGHDSINQWIVCKAECARHGWPTECSACNGEGDRWPSEEAKAVYEAWEQADPPAGDGWQMWETVSEGSPVTPVFATSEELVWHLVIEKGYSEQGARSFVTRGWAISAIADSEGFHSGHRRAGQD
jgi:hypothetical protein